MDKQLTKTQKPRLSEMVSEASVSRSGGLAGMVDDSSQESLAEKGFPLETWLKILSLAIAFIWLTHWQYRSIVLNCLNDANWSHGMIIPLFSFFLLYQRRGDIMTVPRKVNYAGLALMLFGIGTMLYFKYPRGFSYGSQLSMLLILLGMVWFLAGTKMLVLVWLPILYLAFAIPFSEMIYGRIAVPLQRLAAVVSGGIMTFLGVKEMIVTNSNMTFLTQSGQPAELNVVEACSGVRSLMAFAALGVAMAYVANRPFWHRLVMVSLIVPVAIFCNLIRVTVTSWMYYIDKPELGKDFMHTFLGMMMLIPAALLFLFFSWVLSSLFVDDDSQEDKKPDEKSPAIKSREVSS